MSDRSSRKRVLYVIDLVAATGGAERFATSLAAHLPQDRFEPWVCATRAAEPEAAQLLADAGVPLVVLSRRAKWDVHRLRGLQKLLRAHRFDILHTHKFGSNLWGALIGSACGVPTRIAHEHSWAYQGNAARAWLDGKVIGRLVTRFVAVSTADGTRMVTREGISPEKVVVTPNGYIPSPTSEGDLRAELGLDQAVPLIAIAAVLRPEKRLDVLLQAHTSVVAALPDAQLVVAGDGPCRHDLERQARELGIDRAVHFLGARMDVDSILRAADVAALSSDREGCPLLVFECMANGTPIVATAVGGVPEYVEHDRTGLLVPRRDPKALADALIALLTDPPRRATMAAASRCALKSFTIDAIALRFADLYDSLAP